MTTVSGWTPSFLSYEGNNDPLVREKTRLLLQQAQLVQHAWNMHHIKNGTTTITQVPTAFVIVDDAYILNQRVKDLNKQIAKYPNKTYLRQELRNILQRL